MSYFSIAGLQLELPMQDNLETLEKQTKLVCSRFPWVDMVVFSELAIKGASPVNAETMPGDTEVRLQALARDLGIWLVPGSYYESYQGLVYNSVPIISQMVKWFLDIGKYSIFAV
ncbi:aliphatic amidase amiE [Vibrio sp. JCM 19236]|nr:aliphatic amidase amiE [Vibrio sp. JCM 19236]